MPEPHGVPPDVEARLERLEQLVGEAKSVPLSASVMLNRADIEDAVAELRASLPDELTRARWIIEERDQVLHRAQEDGARLLDEARAERDRLMSRDAVVQNASQESERIVNDAREHARRIRLEAEDYVDAKLANFEVVLSKTLGAVEKGRARLRGSLDTDMLSADELDLDFDEPPTGG